MHGLFSEAGTHPRKLAALMTGARVTYPDASVMDSIVFFPGRTYSGNQATAHLWLWVFGLAGGFALACQHLIDLSDARTSRLTWLQMYIDALDACAEGFDLVESLLGVRGESDGPLGDWTNARAQCVSMLDELQAEGGEDTAPGHLLGLSGYPRQVVRPLMPGPVTSS